MYHPLPFFSFFLCSVIEEKKTEFWIYLILSSILVYIYYKVKYIYSESTDETKTSRQYMTNIEMFYLSWHLSGS